MNSRYRTHFKKGQFSTRLDALSQSDVIATEKKLMKEFKFSHGQIHKLIRHKPTILLYEQDYERNKSGVRAMFKVIVEENKLKRKQAQELVIRYPAIVSKSEEDFRNFF